MKETILEIIKFTAPSLVVLATAYFVLRTLLDGENKKAKLEFKISNAKLITPIRLQAYERLVLFLERITPDALFLRTFQPGMNSEQLHRLLLHTIRNEFEHNLSQQVYVSNEAWESVVAAKESVLRLINTVAANPRTKENIQEFTRLVLEAYNMVDRNPTENAIEIIKNEISEQLF